MERDRSGKSFWREVKKKKEGREGIDESIEDKAWLEHFKKQLG